MQKIVILDTGYASYDYESAMFSKAGYALSIYDGPPEHEQLKYTFASEATGLLVRGTKIGKEVLQKMPLLKAIVRYGVGYDNIDLKAAFNKGIKIANVQGYANHAVSDHAMALMFACIRNIGKSHSEAFGKPFRPDVFELHDKTLGIIGIGRIGSVFSKKASPLFSQTLAYDPYKNQEYISANLAIKKGLDELLEKSHVISIHCNLTKETHHLLTYALFKQMKHRPVIINTARGPVIREKDLLQALNKRMVHSAGLDVFEDEPPGTAQEKLLSHPLVISTQHIAWHSDYAMFELQRRAADNLLGLLRGNPVDDELIDT